MKYSWQNRQAPFRRPSIVEAYDVDKEDFPINISISQAH